MLCCQYVLRVVINLRERGEANAHFIFMKGVSQVWETML